jgi:hypothetical protein
MVPEPALPGTSARLPRMRSRRPLRPRPSVTRHRWPVPAGLLLAALVLGACAGYQPLIPAPPATSSLATGAATPSETALSASSPTPTPAPSGSNPGVGAELLPTLAVSATELAFAMPTSIEAGPTRVTLTNDGAEDHNALIVRLDDPGSYPELRAALMGPAGPGIASLASMAGGFAFVPPGGSASIAVDFQPGTYVFIDYARGPDDYPHFAKGMMTPLEVSGPPSTARMPSTAQTLVLTDFSFDGVDSLPPGRQTITVRNDGTQPHEVIIARLADGVTVDAIGAAIRDETSLPAEPWFAVGGSAAIAPGTEIQLDIDLPAGDYAFFCVWSDDATRKQHLQLGMLAPLTVGVP